jgi:hypothetical protein
MDRHDRVGAIVLAAEHFLGLAGVDLLGEGVEPPCEVLVDGLPRLRPFVQDGEVVGFAFERENQVAVLLDAAAALLDLLGFDRVVPEIGRGGARVETAQFFLGPGDLKDSSEDRRRASADPRNGASIRRRLAWTYLTVAQVFRRALRLRSAYRRTPRVISRTRVITAHA